MNLDKSEVRDPGLSIKDQGSGSECSPDHPGLLIRGGWSPIEVVLKSCVEEKILVLLQHHLLPLLQKLNFIQWLILSNSKKCDDCQMIRNDAVMIVTN